MKVIHVVSAIIRHHDAIVMIKQPDEDGLYWFIPGGVVEQGELMSDALSREIKEETGLTITGDVRLAFVTQVDGLYNGTQTIAFVFEVFAHDGELLPDDPDMLIHDAEYVHTDEATQRLNRVLWASMRDPLIAYLKGEIPSGAIWQYRQHAFREFELLHKIH